jgi:hypothetical protein
VTGSLVLSFIITYIKIFGGDGSSKQPCLGKGNARSKFLVSSAHESIKSARKSVREDLDLRWVTNLTEERKRFSLIATLLDPHTKMLYGVSKFLYGTYSRRSQSCGWTSP